MNTIEHVFNAPNHSVYEVVERSATEGVGSIIITARSLLYANVHLDESQWPQFHKDAWQLNQLAAELDSYGYDYYARLMRCLADDSFVIEIINDDEDSANRGNLCASCWLDEHGLFYYEA